MKTKHKVFFVFIIIFLFLGLKYFDSRYYNYYAIQDRFKGTEAYLLSYAVKYQCVPLIKLLCKNNPDLMYVKDVKNELIPLDEDNAATTIQHSYKRLKANKKFQNNLEKVIIEKLNNNGEKNYNVEPIPLNEFNEQLKKNPHYEETYSKLKNSLEGLGTNTHLLNRVVVSRSDIDMKDIRDMYLYKYKNDLIEDISNDTEGQYKDLLVYLAKK